MKAARLLAAVWAVCLLASVSPACPLCESETGRRVRAGIFDENFGPNVALTLLPFLVLLGIVAWIHYGPPRFRQAKPS